jgi:hypothetical protein
MRLSEYMERLRALQEETAPLDPEVAVQRYSDLTTDLNPGYPCLTRMLPEGGDAWHTREHPRMALEQKARLVTVVELARGN